MKENPAPLDEAAPSRQGFISLICLFLGVSSALYAAYFVAHPGSSSLCIRSLSAVCFCLAIYFGAWCIGKKLEVTTDRGKVGVKTIKSVRTFASLPSDLRSGTAVQMTKHYYDIATDWYEAAWGETFQLGGAQGFPGESLAERCRRHDYYVAARAGIRKGQKWLDVGCGVGGPMRNVIRFTGASVVGINISAYQLQKAQAYLNRTNLSEFGKLVECDMSYASKAVESESLDGVYAFESVCHVADKPRCYSEFMKTLKPGGTFACVEWVLTDKFDPKDETHLYCKRSIELFGGVTGLVTTEHVLKCIVEAGFEILEHDDFSLQTTFYPEPWYAKIDPVFSLQNFALTKAGIISMQLFLRLLEVLRLAPKGSADAHRIISSGIDGTALSGKLGIFTPHYFIKARKPL